MVIVVTFRRDFILQLGFDVGGLLPALPDRLQRSAHARKDLGGLPGVLLVPLQA